MHFLKRATVFVGFMMVALVFAACKNSDNSSSTSSSAITSVSIKADGNVTSIDASGSVKLTAETQVVGSPTIVYSWKVISGGDYATVVKGSGSSATLNGTNSTSQDKEVTVQVTAEDGTNSKTATIAITVKAKADTTVPALTGVTINGSSEIEATATTVLTATPVYTGNVDTSAITYEWTIESGSTYAELSGTSGTSVTLTGKNSSSATQNVTVKVTANYNGTKKSTTKSVSIKKPSETIVDELKSVSLDSATYNLDATGTVSVTATPQYTGNPTLTYTWSFGKETSYIKLPDPAQGNNLFSIVLTGINTDTSSHTVTLKVVVSDGKVSKEATASVTVKAAAPQPQPIALTAVNIEGATEIAAAASTELSASVTHTGDNYDASKVAYTWNIVSVDGTAASTSSFATVTVNASDSSKATVQGANTTTSSHKIGIQVKATYNGDASVSATKIYEITIAGAAETVKNELTALSLATAAASIDSNGNTELTATASYTGSPNISYTWSIVTGGDYATLEMLTGGRAVVQTETKKNTLTGANKKASPQEVTVKVVATDGTNQKEATAKVTVGAAKVTGVSVSGETSITATGTTTLTATVDKVGNPELEYEWTVTSGSDYVTLDATTNSTVRITGKNTATEAKQVVVSVTVKNKNDASNSVSPASPTTITVGAKSSESSLVLFPAAGATTAYADTYLEITFDSAPTINRAATGTVRIYKADGTLVDTIKPAAEKMYGYGVGGDSSYGEINAQYQLIQAIGNKVRIIPHHGSTAAKATLLENGTSYYVLVDSGIISVGGTNFAGITTTTEWTFTTGAAPTISGNTLTVGSDKQFITVQGALSYLIKEGKTGSWTVAIDKGTYYERLFYKGNANIVMSGQGTATYGTDVEIQWCNQDGDSGTTLWNTGTRGRNVFYYAGGDLILENLSIINTATRTTNAYGEYDSSATTDTAKGKNQAETLLFDSKGNCAAYNCNFKSKQDTVYLSPSGGKAWFYGCKISGDVDFIWGLSDVALIERCNIISTYDAKAQNTYILAPHFSNSAAPYGKGFVLYKSTVTTESGQTTYLARSPWGSSGNISQVAVIDTAVTGGLASNPWAGTHVGGDDETVLGWKWYGVTSDGSAITASNKLSQSQYEAEFAGRNNIINRTYSGTAFGKAASTWDVNALASARNWTVVADNSKSTLDGETVSKNLTYDFTKITGVNQWDLISSVSATEDSTKTAALSGFKWHSSDYGANISSANATATISVTGACKITVYNSYNVDTDVSLSSGGTQIASGTAAANNSCTLSYTGTAAASLTVTFASSNVYISKIIVEYVAEESSGITVMWSASDYDAQTINSETALGIMTVEALSEKTVSISAATATIDNVAFTKKLSLGGSGSAGSYRTLKFSLSASASITIYAGKAGGTGRKLILTDGTTTYGNEEVSTSGNASYNYTYTGTGGTLYLYSGNSGIDIYGVKIVTGSLSVSSVTISGGKTVVENSSITLKATPNVPTTSAYTWTITNGTGSATGSSTTNTLSLTGVSKGTVTVKATVDGVSSDAFTVTVTEASSGPKISLEDAPTGWANYTGTTYFDGTTANTPADSTKGTSGGYGAASSKIYTVSTRSALLSALSEKSKKIIYIDGMIDMTDGLLPSAAAGTTTALDSWIKTKVSALTDTSKYGSVASDVTSLATWKTWYAAGNTNSADESGVYKEARSSLSNSYGSLIKLNVPSNTTIIGLTSASGIKGGCIKISGVENIVLRNLFIQDSFDPFPQIESGDGFNANWDYIEISNGSKYIWIDHCTIQDTIATTDDDFDHVSLSDGTSLKYQVFDGLCDIKQASDFITVSYCKFANHDKTSLIGHSGSYTADLNHQTITLHHNYYYNCNQRLPMVRFATIHIYNNFYSAPGGRGNSYCIGLREQNRVYAENNYFDSNVVPTSNNQGTYYFTGNYGKSDMGTAAWTPSDYYTYTADSATDAKTNVVNNAGAGVWAVEQ